MKQKIIIIGHGYTSRLGVIRALGREGYYVVDVAVTTDSQQLKKQRPRPIDAYSRYVKEFFYAPATRDGLIDFLIEKCQSEGQKAVLLPESDFAASAIDAAIDRLSPYFYMPNIEGRQGRVQYWMDKNTQKIRAKSFGLNVAESCIIEIRNGQFVIPNGIRYPCFAKPISTLQGGKKGVGRCNTPKELEDRLKLISSYQPSLNVLVEDYLSIDKEYALVGFCDGINVNIPGIIHITHLGQGNHFGVAIAGKVLPSKSFESLIDKFKHLISSTHFVGMFDIDFFECGQKYYFDEINMRIGGSGPAVLACGVNLAKQYVDFITIGHYDSNSFTIKKEKTFVNERMCHDEWYSGGISSKTYHCILESADISFIKDNADPEPYREYLSQHRKSFVKRLIKRILRRIKGQ